jgi:hypothetical protein
MDAIVSATRTTSISTGCRRRHGTSGASRILARTCLAAVKDPLGNNPAMSNNVIDKRLAFGRDWSGTVVNSGRQERSEIPAPPARWPRWGWWCGETPRPDIPTVDEAALPGSTPRRGFRWVPKGTPRHAIDRLNAPVVEAWPMPSCASASQKPETRSVRPQKATFCDGHHRQRSGMRAYLIRILGAAATGMERSMSQESHYALGHAYFSGPHSRVASHVFCCGRHHCNSNPLPLRRPFSTRDRLAA